MSVVNSSLSSTPLATVSDDPLALGGSDLSTLSSVEPEVRILHKAESAAGPSKQRENDKDKEKGIYCHQCRQRCEPDSVLRCTRLKQHGKAPARACNLAFCERDLQRRYNIDAKAIGREKGYEWTCPCCRDICQTSLCRKKKGLEPLGVLPSRRSDVISRPIPSSTAPAPTVSSTPARPRPDADAFGLFDDSDLSDIEEIRPVVTISSNTPGSKSKSVLVKGGGHLVAGSPRSSKAKQVKGKGKPRDSSAIDGEGAVVLAKKDTSKEKTQRKIPKVNLSGDSSAFDRPKKKAKKPPPPPGEKQSEGATKVAVTPNPKKRAKPSLSAGGAVTDASGLTVSTPSKKKAKVKAVVTAGGTKAEPSPKTPKVKKPEVVPEPPVFEKVDTKLGRQAAERRIQLREYLFRFRATLSIPERSLPAVDDFDRPLTDASVRLFGGAMLDLIKDEVDPDDQDLRDGLFRYREEIRYYADLTRFAAIFTSLASPLRLRLASPDLIEDMGRRASRIPPPDEIIRMLLALAERTLDMPAIRADLDATSEVEERRQHARGIKAETARWETQKKKLGAAALQASSPAEGRRIKAELKEGQKEHDVRVAQVNVNLRAALGKKALRHEPLGIDLDGRIYYCLSIRPIDNDSRPPIGWASGLLVWGKGLVDEDELPAAVERWSHFGDTPSVRQLIKWLQYNYKKRLAALPSKSKSKSNSTPTPKSALKHTPKPTPKRTFEIVLPISRKRRRSESSDLSSPPEDIAPMCPPPGYVPPRDALQEQGQALCQRLEEVCQWLDVLEWKGMGEVR